MIFPKMSFAQGGRLWGWWVWRTVLILPGSSFSGPCLRGLACLPTDGFGCQQHFCGVRRRTRLGEGFLFSLNCSYTSCSYDRTAFGHRYIKL
jgi:hypothetical protein